jgi:hypothetical protein
MSNERLMSPGAHHVLHELRRLMQLGTPVTIGALERTELPRLLIESGVAELLHRGVVAARDGGLVLTEASR